MGDIQVIPRKPTTTATEKPQKKPIREPDWTEKRLMAVIRSALRSLWSRLPVRIRAVDRVHDPATGLYRCEECDTLVKLIEVDHIESAGSLLSFDDLPEFCRKLFLVSDDGVKCLCKPCHGKKTLEDNQKLREGLKSK